MTYAYIISNYHEHGAENVRATLNVQMVPALVKQLISSSEGYTEKVHLDYIKTLSSLEKLINSNTDEQLSENKESVLLGGNGAQPHQIQDGWGGIQLHVVKLQ